MPNVNVNIQILDIISASTSNGPWCDTKHRKEEPGSIERLRLFQACHVDLAINPIITDSVGTAMSSGIKFSRGAEGVYFYTFITENGAISDKMSTFVESECGGLKVLTLPDNYAEYGVPLTTQPKVRIVSINGNPLAGKYIMAFVTNEWSIDKDPVIPDYQGFFFLIFYLANRFAYLTGDVSLPSDDNGVAVFTNLTVRTTLS